LNFNVTIDEEKKVSKYEIVVTVEKTDDLITNNVGALRPKAATQHAKVVLTSASASDSDIYRYGVGDGIGEERK
jgi:hypothetical protein